MKCVRSFRIKVLVLVGLLLPSIELMAQVGIGNTNPDPSALLHIDDGQGNKGLLVPSVNIVNLGTPAPVTNPAIGLAVWNTNPITGPGYYTWTGTKWNTFYDPKDWRLAGNSGTTPGTGLGEQYLGTADTKDIVIATKRIERLRIMQNFQIQAAGYGNASAPFYSWKINSGTGMFQQAAGVLAFATDSIERFRIPNADQVHATKNGSAAAPFYSWSSYAGTGTFVPTANALGFSTNGTERFRIANEFQVQALENGTATVPFYSWSGFTRTGFFLPEDNAIGFTTNGSERLRIPNGNQIQGGSNGSATAPFYSWITNSNMGMFGAGDNLLAFSTSSAERLRILDNGQIAINRTTPINTSRLTVWEAGANTAIYGRSVDGEGVRGEATTGDGIVGAATTGRGVYGQASTGSGVSGLASSSAGQGGYFAGSHSNGFGLLATGGGSSPLTFLNSGTGAAITGKTYGTTSMATAANGTGVVGIGNNINALPGSRPSGVGVLGYGFQAGVFGSSDDAGQTGVYGRATGDAGAGVYGENMTGAGYGVDGNSNNVGIRGRGLQGALLQSTSDLGYGAVILNTSGSGSNRIGLVVAGQNQGITPFAGTGATFTGLLAGGAGVAESPNGTGLVGIGNSAGTALLASSGSGVAGTGLAVGVYGKANRDLNGVGVIGLGNNLGAYFVPSNGAGVAGTGLNVGVFGEATLQTGYGVYSAGNLYADGTITSTGDINTTGNISATGDISATGNISTQGNIDTNGGDLSTGNMTVVATLTAQTVSVIGDFTVGGIKNFLIDDPRDPANKFLRHTSIESNEILNLYRGTSTFDASGQVLVQLPDYYDAINKNASYQLTPIGAAMPNLYISEEVSNGVFGIAGGVPGKKVAWTIMAERNDPYIRDNPEIRNIVVDKGAERGFYLAPESYGQAADKGILNHRVSEMRNPSVSAVENKKIETQEMQSVAIEVEKVDMQKFLEPNTSSDSRPAKTVNEPAGSQGVIKAEELKVNSKVIKQEEQNGTTDAAPAKTF